ncbi:hypothetical protein [Clostridium oryzae]|uniref:Uncharacterized protein n=1 Tax=Clostridium oryzae TaxID=1450648 RepID=A0A1V4IEC5_9CLOT|nr:hypothetical protein [Clostridium oryzae]OPJ58358.1 hypothetical protein CLORY_36520 [Clostridium oryzae]
MALSFDTPQTGSVYNIQVTGTVGQYATLGARVTVNVTGTPARSASTFYRVIPFDNSTSSVVNWFHGTYGIAIVPKLEGTQTATSTIQWEY